MADPRRHDDQRALGAGGKAQQFAQTMAIADIQKQLVAAGINMVVDRELYNTATELTRIMGHKNAAPFFNDPAAINPQTGQLLHPPPTPPAPPPDPKLVAAQARAQLDQATAVHRAQLDQQQAQNDAIHLQVKTQEEIDSQKIKAALDAKMTLLEAHLTIEGRKVQRSYPGARKVARRHRYVPEPARPDKYLLVLHSV